MRRSQSLEPEVGGRTRPLEAGDDDDTRLALRASRMPTSPRPSATWVSGGAADIDTLTWARLRAVDLRPIAGSRLPAGRDVGRSELAALLAQCRSDDTPAGVPDAAVIGLAYLSGTRRAELVPFIWPTWTPTPATIRVVAKGACSGWCPSPPLSARSSRLDGAAGRIGRSALLPHRPQGQPPPRPHPQRRGHPPDPLPPNAGHRPGRRVPPDLRRTYAGAFSTPAPTRPRSSS